MMIFFYGGQNGSPKKINKKFLTRSCLICFGFFMINSLKKKKNVQRGKEKENEKAG